MKPFPIREIIDFGILTTRAFTMLILSVAIDWGISGRQGTHIGTDLVFSTILRNSGMSADTLQPENTRTNKLIL